MSDVASDVASNTVNFISKEILEVENTIIVKSSTFL
jgi:hypothetical protein